MKHDDVIVDGKSRTNRLLILSGLKMITLAIPLSTIQFMYGLEQSQFNTLLIGYLFMMYGFRLFLRAKTFPLWPTIGLVLSSILVGYFSLMFFGYSPPSWLGFEAGPMLALLLYLGQLIGQNESLQRYRRLVLIAVVTCLAGIAFSLLSTAFLWAGTGTGEYLSDFDTVNSMYRILGSLIPSILARLVAAGLAVFLTVRFRLTLIRQGWKL